MQGEWVRSCVHCQKNVHDLSQLTYRDLERMIREQGSLCVRYRKPSRMDAAAPGMEDAILKAPSKWRWWRRGGIATMGICLMALTVGTGTKQERLFGMFVSDVGILANYTKADVRFKVSGLPTQKINVDPLGRFEVIAPSKGRYQLDVSLEHFETKRIKGEIGVDRTLEVPLDGGYHGLGVMRIIPPMEEYVRRHSERKDDDWGSLKIAGSVLPVHVGVVKHDLDLIRRHLSFGFPVDLSGLYGETPLMRAVKHLDTVQLLLEHGANPNHASSFGVPVLSYAVLEDNREVVSLLLDRGADPNKRDDQGRTPTLLAAMSGRAELLELMLKTGGDPDTVDDQGQTLLHYAAMSNSNGARNMLRYAIELSSDLDVVDEWGETPLMKAAVLGNDVIILREAGAGLDYRNIFGQDALSLAVISKNMSAYQFLEDEGMDLNRTDTRGHTPIDHIVDIRKREHWLRNSDIQKKERWLRSSGEPPKQ